jgi:hypothetical protein
MPAPGGGLAWRPPSGEWITTHPPRFGADDDLGPPENASDPLHEPADDPPPF